MTGNGSRPPRVAFVCSDPGIPLFGCKGASIHAQAVIEVLVSAGHEVHVLTPRPGPFPDHRLAGRARLHRLPEIGSGPAAVRERAAQRSDRAIGAILDDLQPEVVYQRYALWGRATTQWCRRVGVPNILEVNAPLIDEQADFRGLVDRTGAEAVAGAIFAEADVISCVSEGVADWVRSRSARPDSIMVLPNGVDTSRIRPAPGGTRGADVPDFTVGFLGTLKPWHGVQTIIDGMSRRHGEGWRLLVVGDGPLRNELSRSAAAAGVRAEFTGAVAPDRVASQLHRMDLGCAPYPASDDHYFSPLKVFEYLAAGVPVVASAIGQIPDILEQGRIGRLVAPGDAQALGRELSLLRRDTAERVRLARAGRQTAVERHTWTAVVYRALAAAGLQLGTANGTATSRPREPVGI